MFAEFVPAVLRPRFVPALFLRPNPRSGRVLHLDFGIYGVRALPETNGSTDDKKSSCEPGAREEAPRPKRFFLRVRESIRLRNSSSLRGRNN